MPEVQRPVLYPRLARRKVHGNEPQAESRQTDDEQQRAQAHYHLPRGPREVHAHAHARAVVYHRAPVVWVVINEAPDPELVLVHIVRAALAREPLLRPPRRELRTQADIKYQQRVQQRGDHKPQRALPEYPQRHGQERREPGQGHPDLAPVVAPHAGQRRVHTAVRIHHVRPLPEHQRVEENAHETAERKGTGEDKPAPALALASREHRQHAGYERYDERRDEQPARIGPSQLLRLRAEVRHHRARVGRRPALLLFERPQPPVAAREQHEKRHERRDHPEHHPGQVQGRALYEKRRQYRRRQDEKPEPDLLFVPAAQLLHPRVVLRRKRQGAADDNVLLRLRLVRHDPGYDGQQGIKAEDQYDRGSKVAHFSPPPSR